jgi:hypothetical protein
MMMAALSFPAMVDDDIPTDDTISSVVLVVVVVVIATDPFLATFSFFRLRLLGKIDFHITLL